MMTGQLASYRDAGIRFRQCCFGVVAVTCLVSWGCTGEKSVTATQSSRQGSISPDASNSAPALGKIKFKIGDGQTAFSWKPQADGAKLVDADEKEISRYNRDETKLKIKVLKHRQH